MISPDSNVFAVQREKPMYLGNEGSFADFPIFRQPIPSVGFTERLGISIANLSGSIDVSFIELEGISAAAVIQIGNTRRIEAVNRTKHIRQLLPRPDYQSGGS